VHVEAKDEKGEVQRRNRMGRRGAAAGAGVDGKTLRSATRSASPGGPAATRWITAC
jgi:hypothetical protein